MMTTRPMIQQALDRIVPLANELTAERVVRICSEIGQTKTQAVELRKELYRRGYLSRDPRVIVHDKALD